MARGRKAAEFTEEQRKQAVNLARFGMHDDEIAIFFGKSETTVKKYLGAELARGRVTGNAAVQQRAFRMATSGECPAMTIFWLKTRCKWRETDSDNGNFDPKNLSDDELRNIATGKKKGAG